MFSTINVNHRRFYLPTKKKYGFWLALGENPCLFKTVQNSLFWFITHFTVIVESDNNLITTLIEASTESQVLSMPSLYASTHPTVMCDI